MGDSSQVVPLTGSPLRYLAKVSYEKFWQTLKPLIFISQKIVRTNVSYDRDGHLTEDESIIWIILIAIPICSMLVAVFCLARQSYLPPVVGSLGLFGHIFVVYSVIYWCRDKPFQLTGAKVKFMAEVIPMITTAALHHFLEFNYGYLALVICCTTYFYVFGHFMHIAYDIGEIDVMLGLGMQVLAYMLNPELLVGALALSFCFGISFYRYMTYSAPEVPAHRKKELDRLPC